MPSPVSSSSQTQTTIASAETTLGVADGYLAAGRYEEAVMAYKTASSQVSSLPGFPAPQGTELAGMSPTGATAQTATSAGVVAAQVVMAVSQANPPPADPGSPPPAGSPLATAADVALAVGALALVGWLLWPKKRRA